MGGDDNSSKVVENISDTELEALIEVILKHKYLTNSGIITNILKEFLENDDIARKAYGEYINILREKLRGEILEKIKKFNKKEIILLEHLSEKERAYLSAILFLQRKFNLQLVISPLVYEVLRCVGIEEELPHVTDRSLRALRILMKLKERGLIQQVSPKFEWKTTAGKPKYFFVINKEIENLVEGLKEYKLLVENYEKIKNDQEFRKTLETFKLGFREKQE